MLDEPTNDLDIETLDLLEELLLEFSGTLLVVSHDRAFLDNVVTSTLVFEGDGTVAEYAGGYTDWVRQRPALRRAGRARALEAYRRASRPGEHRQEAAPQLQGVEGTRGLPQEIDAREQERERLYASLADPAFLRDGAAVARGEVAAGP